jgi:hypothetical protein
MDNVKDIAINCTDDDGTVKKALFDVTSNDVPGHFLIQAIVQGKALGEKITKNPVEVELLVNGVRLPFKSTLENLWERAEARLDMEARKLAEDMVTEAGLEGVAEALRDVEWKVKDALSKVGDKKEYRNSVIEEVALAEFALTHNVMTRDRIRAMKK